MCDGGFQLSNAGSEGDQNRQHISDKLRNPERLPLEFLLQLYINQVVDLLPALHVESTVSPCGPESGKGGAVTVWFSDSLLFLDKPDVVNGKGIRDDFGFLENLIIIAAQ